MLGWKQILIKLNEYINTQYKKNKLWYSYNMGYNDALDTIQEVIGNTIMGVDIKKYPNTLDLTVWKNNDKLQT